METTKNLYTPSLALARQVKAAATRVGLSQYKLAQILGVSPASMSKRLTGQKEFTFSDLLVIAGALDMSLSELLGDDIANTKMPAPSYVEDAGKRKVAPIGFVPNGATYQIISGEECALWGSNPRPADYQTQSPKTRHTAQKPAPHWGFYIALLVCMCNQSQHTEKRKPCFGNHIRATLRPGNSPPAKRTPRQKHANIGFNTSHVHIR